MSPGVGSAVSSWRIVTNTLTSRARLRSEALIEPYQESLRYVRSLAPRDPVVPVPSRLQCDLEGLIVGHIGYLFDPVRGQIPEYRRLEPLRIWASEREYTVKAATEGLASTLGRLLPRWSSQDREVQSGIAGLRCTDYKSGAGLSFFFPGQAERFHVLGISLRELESFRTRNIYSTDLRTVRPGDPLHPQERGYVHQTHDRLLPLSAIARRLGLFVNSNVDAVDSWWSDSRRFSIELLTSDDRPDPMPLLLRKLQSPYLSPGLRLNVRDSNSYNYVLEADDSDSRIDLRYNSRSYAPPPPLISPEESGPCAGGPRTSAP
jgi:hypothetical protein